MSNFSQFGTTAKGLAKNPLGIIALFIVLIYGFAALTLGFNQKLEVQERVPLVWFLVAFPVIVLCLFGWLVSQHPEKLYAPGDFRSDDNFLKRSIISQRHTAELLAEGEELKNTIRETVKRVVGNHPVPDEIAERIVKDITEATTISVDARQFTGSAGSVFIYPVAAFETFGDLLDEVYLKLYPMVRPYHYGSAWILRNVSTGEPVRSLRMILGALPGQPLHDTRSLKEVGIQSGSTLLVERLVK